MYSYYTCSDAYLLLGSLVCVSYQVRVETNELKQLVYKEIPTAQVDTNERIRHCHECEQLFIKIFK